MTYSIELEIPSYLCDVDDLLHPWAAIRLCQEISEYHTNELHIGFDDMKKDNRAWVLSRAYYCYKRRPRAFEKVMLTTWSRGHDGLFAFRDYEMTTPEGEVLITGTSYWPVIDMTNRRVVRLHSILDNFPHEDKVATDRPTLDRLKIADMTDDDLALQINVRYSMIDHTGHVNNSEYNKWMFDVLSADGYDLRKPFNIEINYQTETKNLDTARVSCKQYDSAVDFQILNSRGLAVMAKITR